MCTGFLFVFSSLAQNIPTCKYPHIKEKSIQRADPEIFLGETSVHLTFSTPKRCLQPPKWQKITFYWVKIPTKGGGGDCNPFNPLTSRYATPFILIFYKSTYHRFCLKFHTLKLSPQPHVPLMFGLLNINSADNLSVW